MAKKTVATEHHTSEQSQKEKEEAPKKEVKTARFRWSKSMVFIAFVAVAAVGYIGGTYNAQISAAILPIFGIQASGATLDLSSLQQTYRALKANFDGTLDNQALINGANAGLVAAANDTYTVYMTKQQYAQFNDDLTGNIGGGIGAEISLRNNKPTIVQVLPNNPAAAAGLQAGDVIDEVNGTSTTNQTVDQVVSAIRGQVGTVVKLQLTRGSQTLNVSITRATVDDPSVMSSVTNGIGVITISRFDDQTGSLAQQAAQSLVQQHVKGIILDLRDNGGGYVDAAQTVASLWVPGGKTITTERRNGVIANTVTATGDTTLAGLPTVVLVNGNSASASEIVTGALKDYKLATIIGTKTFGKGSMQTLINLDYGAVLKVTIAEWYTPDGYNINHQGITPNQTVDLTAAESNAGQDPQMTAAMKQLGQ